MSSGFKSQVVPQLSPVDRGADPGAASRDAGDVGNVGDARLRRRGRLRCSTRPAATVEAGHHGHLSRPAGGRCDPERALVDHHL